MNIILFLSGESNILQTSRGVCIVFHHEKIKFISPSHWVIFFLFNNVYKSVSH